MKLKPEIKSKIRNSLKFIFPGALFYMTLDLFFKSFGFSISAVFLLFLLSAASAYWIGNRKLLAVIPSLLVAGGSVTFLLGIGQSSLQRYFILFVSFVFMITLIAIARFFTPEEKRPQQQDVRLLDTGFNLNQAVIIFAVFFLSCGIYGIYIIVSMPTWQMMLIMAVGIFFASFYLIEINFQKSQELELHLDYYKNRAFNFYSFLSTFLVIELVWTLTYLPINHLTFGAIILTVFYSYWNIIRAHLRSELTHKYLMENVILPVIAITIILATSRLYIN